MGAPAKLTYYADALKYYRALAAATPRVKIETIGTSDEDRELVVVWVSSDDNIKNLQQNRDNLAKIADPRGLSETQINQLVATTKPHYHLMGGLHSGETGPSEMLMELVYRLATETSPLIKQIRENVIVSVTPQADPDGRDRNVDWFNRTNDQQSAAAAGGGTGAGGGSGAAPAEAAAAAAARPPCRTGASTSITTTTATLTSRKSRCARSSTGTSPAHPPIMHDLHESLTLLYTYSGAAPQNPNLDPILFTELPFFSNFELSQMTKWGMPGVYTHAFMDGWSPGYLGSVAYNHNGMMRMYETQSGRESGPGALPQVAVVRRRQRVRRAAVGAQKAEEREQQKAGETVAPLPRAVAPAARVGAKRSGLPAMPAAAASPRQPAVVVVKPASGTAASRCRRTLPTRSRGATTPTTCRQQC